MTESEIPRFLRLKQIIGDPKAEPPIQPILPISKSSWWDGVKSGRFPKAIKTSYKLGNVKNQFLIIAFLYIAFSIY